MNPRLTLATVQRVLAQIRHDHRTMALLVAVPSLLMTLLWWIYDGGRIFDQVGAPLLGIFPLIIMFLITSVTTLRERTSGTLERLMTMPIRRADFVVGYAIALGFAALIQTSLVATYAIVVLDLQVAGPEWMLVCVSVLSAILGVTMGLASSSLARTEFQAVQFMPALILPQLLLCGLLVPRELMPPAAEAISNVLPLSYAVDAVKEVAMLPNPTIGFEVAIIGAVHRGAAASWDRDPAPAFGVEGTRRRGRRPWARGVLSAVDRVIAMAGVRPRASHRPALGAQQRQILGKPPGARLQPRDLVAQLDRDQQQEDDRREEQQVGGDLEPQCSCGARDDVREESPDHQQACDHQPEGRESLTQDASPQELDHEGEEQGGRDDCQPVDGHWATIPSGAGTSTARRASAT